MTLINQKKLIYILSAPSGAGKTSLLQIIKKTKFQKNYICISYTTRQPRYKEIHGIDYYFINYKLFNKMIKNNKFIEYAKVYNQYYGTSKQSIFKTLSSNNNIILEIDYQGAKQIQNIYKKQCVSVFILPPSLKILHARLLQRNKDSKLIISQRMAIVQIMTLAIKEYNYIIINDNFKKALHDFLLIFNLKYHTYHQLL